MQPNINEDMHMHLYVYMYAYIRYTYISLYVCMSPCIHICCINVYIYVCRQMWMYVYMCHRLGSWVMEVMRWFVHSWYMYVLCINIYILLGRHLHMQPNINEDMHLYVYMYAYIRYIYISLYVCMSPCIHICCIHVYIYVCRQMWMYVYMCHRLGSWVMEVMRWFVHSWYSCQNQWLGCWQMCRQVSMTLLCMCKVFPTRKKGRR